MNLTDYFEPVDFDPEVSDHNLPARYSLGFTIKKFTPKFLSGKTKNCDIVLIGAPYSAGKQQGSETLKKIRRELYSLANPENNIKIADLGNLKPATSIKGILLALRDVVEYLAELNILTIVIGGTQELTAGICNAFKNDRFFWLSVIDSSLDVKKRVETFNYANYLTSIFKNLPDIFQFSLIGYQTHLTGEKIISRIKQSGEYMRLGRLRERFSDAESILQNTDVLSFDMGAVKFSEAPSTIHKNPNGLRSEEACQLARYAGLSSKIKVFGLFNILESKKQEHDITTKLAAEIIWYFIEAAGNKNFPVKKIIYNVSVEGLDKPITFKHEKETGRWWFEIGSLTGETIDIACTYRDYMEASENGIPEKWLKYVQKMDDLSK